MRRFVTAVNFGGNNILVSVICFCLRLGKVPVPKTACFGVLLSKAWRWTRTEVIMSV